MPCPAGMYAAHYGSPNSACDAPCACPIGRYCPAGSTSPTLGSTNCLACPIGSYCSGGGAPAVACPAGRYGSAPSLASIGCSGTCNATGGNWCGPAQMASPARCLPRSSARLPHGAVFLCPGGTYNSQMQAGSLSNCTLCPANTYSSALNATGVVVCTPCAQYENSTAGSVVCWPGIVSIIASNPPPVVPMVSVGDIITVTFSKPTNAPHAVAAYVMQFLLFSAPIASVLTASWSSDSTALIVTVDSVSPSLNITASRIGVLSVSLNTTAAAGAYCITDKLGLSHPAQYEPTMVSGTWGVPNVPGFAVAGGLYSPSYARNTGGQAGLGVGDSLMLRFDTLCEQVPVASTSDIDQLLNFSSPIGTAYTGQWVTSGRFANTAIVVTITEALTQPNPRGTSVGVLHVSVLVRAGMRSLDESTAPSNASTTIAMGTWVDVPSITAIQRSYRSLRVTVSAPVGAQ